MRKQWNFLVVGLLAVATASTAGAIDVSWTPEHPTHGDILKITVGDAEPGATLHWSVNKEQGTWVASHEAYRPSGSEQWDKATRTPLAPSADGSTLEVQLGPFHHPGQYVRSVHFAVQLANGGWENNGGQDFQIPIFSDRIQFFPAHPSASDQIEVQVHRVRSGSGILHWGVNESKPGDWKQVHPAYQPKNTGPKGSANAVETVLPPPDRDGVSRLTLGPFDSGAQVVTSLHAVVRWGDDWDADGGRNYNLTIADADAPGDIGRITGIERGSAIHEDTELVFHPGSQLVDTIEFWVDGEPTARIPAAEGRWTLPVADLRYGPHRLNVVLRGDTGRHRSIHDFWYHPPVDIRRTPVGCRPGAREVSEGLVRFSLYAPGKRFVSIIGSFNDSDPSVDVMHRSPNGTWWLDKELPPGDYLYQYLVDGQVRLADPYSTDVEWKDEVGHETWKPERALSRVRVGAESFAWHDHLFRRPALEELIIYEFYLEDLVPGRGFLGVIDKLDYIQSLGCNAIEMLPVTEFAGADSWGYNPAFHFAPETTYGTPDDLKTLVQACHDRGLAFIVDLVFNHMDVKSPLYQLYGDDLDASPYFQPVVGDNWGFPDMEQGSLAAKTYFADAVCHWMREYHVDGIRYDATRFVGWQGSHDWGAGWFAHIGKLEDPGAYQIAEHLPADPMLMQRTEMDTNWDSEFRWRIREMLVDARLNLDAFPRVMNPALAGYENPYQRLIYLENHDEERFIRDLLQAGYSRDEADRRVWAGHVLLLTAPGIPMIYSGEEFGEDTDRVVGKNPLHWDKLEAPRGAAKHAKLSRLLQWRSACPALRNGRIKMLNLDSRRQLAVYQRETVGSMVLVAVNFGRGEQRLEMTIPEDWEWTQVLTGDAEPSGATLRTLLPGETLLLEGVPRSVDRAESGGSTPR